MTNGLKTSTFIIIPKPNKTLHDTPKIFRLIVLLNMLDKLIEKVIGDRLQFQALSKNTIHSYQLDGLKQCFITSAGIVLTHLIQASWVKNCSTSTLAFDIAQFFLSLNYQILSIILDKT